MKAKFPTLRETSRMVREANAAWDGGEYAALTDCCGVWMVQVLDHLMAGGEQHGREWIPGDGSRIDSTAVARRLLAALRDATT